MSNKDAIFDVLNFNVIRGRLSEARAKSAIARITRVVPDFKYGERIALKDLDKFLKTRYNARNAEWREIDKCTRTKIKRHNKYCDNVFCVSEAHVTDEEYCGAYIIKRENCIDPSDNADDFFYDVFIIVGSEDGIRLSSYYIGGYSDGLAEELYVLCGNN